MQESENCIACPTEPSLLIYYSQVGAEPGLGEVETRQEIQATEAFAQVCVLLNS